MLVEKERGDIKSRRNDIKETKWQILTLKFTYILYLPLQFRNGVIHPTWKEELYRYMTGTIQNNNHKLIDK